MLNNLVIKRENELSKIVLDVCFKIHKMYGPGLFESVADELQKENLAIVRHFPIPLLHENIKLEAGFRADVFVEDLLLLELKSVEEIGDIHYKQVQTYLKLTKLKLGLLINFNVVFLKDGIKRIINTY